MKRLLLLFCVSAMVLLLTCSKKSTDSSNGNNPPPDTTFAISYTSDPSRMVEQSIPAATGGSVAATDADGVLFTLTIPPGALPDDAVIRVTPLASLNLGGLAGNLCAGCSGDDPLCCLRGILLEPEGLVLDSPATLTMTFPADQFPFVNGGWIAYLDSAGAVYNVCHTDIDTAAHTLRARITHFSGYGSDDPRYKRLEQEIYRIAALLEAAIGTASFDIYSNMLLALYPAFECQGDGCPDFSDLYAVIETILLDDWTSHVYAVRHSITGTSCDALQALYGCHYELTHSSLNILRNWDAFSGLEVELMSDARAMAHFVADLGKGQCAHDSCASGQRSLSCVADFIRDADLAEQEGPLLDSALAWFTKCCQNKLTLSVDKPKIYDFALTEGDESQVALFTATLTDEVGPIPDHEIVITGYNADGRTIGGQASTDDDGVAKIPIFAAPEGIHVKSMGMYKCVAYTTVGEDQIKSDTVVLTITGRVVVMTYVYQYTQSGSSQYCSHSGTHYFSGIGKRSFAVSCEGSDQWFLTRSIHITTSCSSPEGSTSAVYRSLPKNDSAYCCFFDLRYNGRWIDEPAPGYPQYLLAMARVNWLWPLDNCWVEITMSDQYGTRVDTTSVSCYAMMPDDDDYVDTSLYANGGFTTLTWDTTIVAQDGNYSYHPSWTISFYLEEED